MQFLQVMMLLLTGVVLVTPAVVHSSPSPWSRPCWWGRCGQPGGRGQRGARGNIAARIFLVGACVLFLTTLNDIFFFNGLIYTFYAISFGLLFFIFGQPSALSSLRPCPEQGGDPAPPASPRRGLLSLAPQTSSVS